MVKKGIFLIVNGDDLGASRGINRGILEAYRRGILTSASLMVNARESEQAAVACRTVPGLDIGLHVELLGNGSDDRSELGRQLSRFVALMGRLPTHLDSHRNVHREPRILPLFVDLAGRCGVPLRDYSPVHYFSKFYGQWSGEMHLEQISAENLVRMLEAEIREGITELGCHPGYADPDFPTSYSIERETELATLCAPRVREFLAERSIQLTRFRDLGDILGPDYAKAKRSSEGASI